LLSFLFGKGLKRVKLRVMGQRLDVPLVVTVSGASAQALGAVEGELNSVAMWHVCCCELVKFFSVTGNGTLLFTALVQLWSKPDLDQAQLGLSCCTIWLPPACEPVGIS
jgi:hypothetical protein